VSKTFSHSKLKNLFSSGELLSGSQYSG